MLRVSDTENAELFWGLRGGGGNFGVVPDFEFRLHPVTGQSLVVDLFIPLDDAEAALAAGAT